MQDEEASWQHPTPQSCKLLTLVMEKLTELLRERKYEAGSISIVTLIEVLRGLEVEKRGRVKKLLEETFNLQNLDNEIIETYCKIYCGLKEKATLIPDADLLVAATAIARNLTLKTRDEHFQRLEELGLRRAEA